MEAQVWTLIGLFGATILGSFVYLGQKIDAQSARIDNLSGRIEDLGRDLGDRIYAVAGKLDEHLRRHAS